jgi:hypothetical protein
MRSTRVPASAADASVTIDPTTRAAVVRKRRHLKVLLIVASSVEV